MVDVTVIFLSEVFQSGTFGGKDEVLRKENWIILFRMMLIFQQMAMKIGEENWVTKVTRVKKQRKIPGTCVCRIQVIIVTKSMVLD